MNCTVNTWNTETREMLLDSKREKVRCSIKSGNTNETEILLGTVERPNDSAQLIVNGKLYSNLVQKLFMLFRINLS